ncbi:thioredoxin-disulfide reductase [Candidatus Babeliales bacterium]|nr:thioredoxin-disulfide reductase [Candidatus Babeliales bacterium]MCF7899800.1 thioredoxin-disulfide reductase [Candidatus Babeliales bacterium]
MVHKVIIIGSGPAGLTAGIYSARSGFDPILLAGNQPGGQLTTTTKVENWPGNTEIMGPQLMMNMQEHAKNYGCQILFDTVEKVDFSKKSYKIVTQDGAEYLSESVIIATGASHKKLNIPGEKEYWSKGVSVCATCDAPFFRDKHVVVVGGGNSAVQEADHIAKFATKVTVVHILDKLTANDPIKDKVLENPKISIIYNSTVKEIMGDDQKVTQVLIENQKDKKTETVKTDGVFIAIGMKPNTEIFKDQIDLDSYGFIKQHENTQTNKKGVFAAGDVCDFIYRQAITAAGQGCMAALDCEKYLGRL